MAVEPVHGESQSGEHIEAHVRDYSAFIKMFKWGAILSFITVMLVMMLISN